MFNLLVKQGGWANSRDTIGYDRLLEHTADYIKEQFISDGNVDPKNLISLPSLFLDESNGETNQLVRVGNINSAVISGGNVSLTYEFDPDISHLTNSFLKEIAIELDITKFEFSRTHWAVKDVDLYKVLIKKIPPKRRKPLVFKLSDPENIDPKQVSVMMPFDRSFDAVYEELKRITECLGFRCNRADDIWDNPEVIQDVVSLIDRSKIVICDCSRRNPNVFYEIGISHTLGRETILITQSNEDIPFDLRHLRFVSYLNNAEGLSRLGESLSTKLEQFLTN